MASWRTGSVTLLSFSSGLPLGLVWIAIPDWMRKSGIDIRIIGLITLAQAPWSFKLLWSPLMDRYALPWLGRRRGWIAAAQIVLFALGLAMAGLGSHPDTPWVLLALSLAIAFAAASQDIAYDAWTVDVLEPDEQGIAAGAKVALYRGAMFIAGGFAISSAAWLSWPLVNLLLAALYLPMILVTVLAPEPVAPPAAPKTVAEAVWHPFLGFLARHRALEILAFVFFYKFSDNVAEALKRPFLVDMGYSDFHRGIALGIIGWVVVAGALLGGAITSAVGLGHALWIFGFLQIFSNIGYIVMARVAPDLWILMGAMGFESFTQGLGTGAFVALMLRLTQKRFSATQFALFSSLFALPRIVAGPISGVLVDALGWEAFFWSTILMGVPGLVLLQRFSPIGVREPVIAVEERGPLPPLSRGSLAARGVCGGLAGWAMGAIALALVVAVKQARAEASAGFDLAGGLLEILTPEGIGGWLQTLGLMTFGVIVGLMTAAVFAARHGQAASLVDP